MTKSRLFLVLPLLLALGVGCVNNTNVPSKVSGKVSYKGQPVTAGNISFYPKEGGVYSISINGDGTYAQAGLPAGDMEVAIETESANPNKPAAPQYGGKMGAGAASPMPRDIATGSTPAAGPYVKIPAKYGKRETSGLKVTLSKGNNSGKDFDLTD
jgi:hypothetical protein